MLSIKGLKAKVANTDILKGVDLEIKPGEIHGIMGPNGSGKSTLARVIAGDPTYTVQAGSINYNGEDVFSMAPDKSFVCDQVEGVCLGMLVGGEIGEVAPTHFSFMGSLLSIMLRRRYS